MSKKLVCLYVLLLVLLSGTAMAADMPWAGGSSDQLSTSSELDFGDAPLQECLLEDFETNDFSKLPWEHYGDASWAVTSRQKHSGAYSARADSIDHDQSTTLKVSLDCVSGNITFYRKVSSESRCDYLRFYIDGAEKGKWSGEEDWAKVSFGVTAGTRTFEWTYSKDGSESEGHDTAWVDDIVFPVCDTDDTDSELDFGDAPEPLYPTSLAANGARHVIVPGFCLGNSIDREPDGQPTASADGDDTDTQGNDEDGVLFGSLPLIPGQLTFVNVTNSMAPGSIGFLDAWIDFNGDGSWAELGDQIFVRQPLSASGCDILFFQVPATATPNIMTFARFRFSSTDYLSYDGPAQDGEVEDYSVIIGQQEEPEIKWIQLPDLSPEGIDIDVTKDDSQMKPPCVLADDFECTVTEDLWDIHIWGSWYHDYMPLPCNPTDVMFTLSIHTDIPAGQSPTGYSMPGPMLWTRQYQPWEFKVRPEKKVAEGWYDPVADWFEPVGSYRCWQYSFYLKPGESRQEGTLDKPEVYWLAVQAQPADPNALFGWKSSIDHWNDDAVWASDLADDWKEVSYPPGHPYHPNSVDMAFSLTYPPEQPTSRPVIPTQCPPVETECPPVDTECPEEATECPPYVTECSTHDTVCPPVETECPAVASECAIVDTVCPEVTTECPAVDTECPAMDTECPSVATECPAMETECPAVNTECPAWPTECLVVDTECPAMDTECPSVATECPAMATECPATATECPPVATECPGGATECPPLETECPAEATECPPVATECPAVATECPGGPTECPFVSTECPPVDTHCPEVETVCWSVFTECETLETYCPVVETECSGVWTECPVEETMCPIAETECPVNETCCPIVETECGPVLPITECLPTVCPGSVGPLTIITCGICYGNEMKAAYIVTAPCPVIEAPCPSVVPKHLLTAKPKPVAQNTAGKTQL